MKWEGPYKVQCPKCKGRNIWLSEITEGGSQHFIKNGVWDHSYDDNEYGMIVRSEMTCNDCGHKWTKQMTSIDSFLDESHVKRKKENNYIKEIRRLTKDAERFTEEFKKLNTQC